MISALKNRIYLNELLFLINRKDKRAVRSWCLKNKLKIYKDSSGEFVNESEFTLTYNLPLITNLRKLHGELWKEYYEFYQNDELYKLINIESRAKNTNYKPQGKISSKIFDTS